MRRGRVRRLPLAARGRLPDRVRQRVAWGLIVPPFHVPDETAHAFYAQYLAETGELPRRSARQRLVRGGRERASSPPRGSTTSSGEPGNRPPWGARRRARVRARRSDRGSTARGSATPPPRRATRRSTTSRRPSVYRAAHGADVTRRLVLMRLALRAAGAALTVLCVFLFLRELLPGSPLAVDRRRRSPPALQPMFAFISSGVNNDAGLYLVSAAAVPRLRARAPPRADGRGGPSASGSRSRSACSSRRRCSPFAPARRRRARAWPRARRARAWRPLLAAAGAGAVPLALYGVLGGDGLGPARVRPRRRGVRHRRGRASLAGPRAAELPAGSSYRRGCRT